MSAVACPGRDEISAYLLGVLDQAAADRIDRHLAKCKLCQAIADELELMGDALVGSLKKPVHMDFVEEPACLKGLERARDVRRGRRPDDRTGQPLRSDEQRMPARLGPFELIAPIGRGGMGIVYKARHTTLDRVVAVKVLSEQRIGTTAAADRFLREIRAMGRLDHPNIVRPIDASAEGDIYYLAMDFVEGFDLTALIERHGQLPVADVCEIGRQAAAALQYVHEQGTGASRRETVELDARSARERKAA